MLDNINSGALKVGEKLPSENELSEHFGLSRQTVRHAVDILEQQKQMCIRDRLKIQPMVATLILFTAGRGISQLVTNGQITYIRVDGYRCV